jgi:hypothetical protein
MRYNFFWIAGLVLCLAPSVWADEFLTNAPAHEALKNATILIIRHAEKPDEGVTLSPDGTLRAQAYVKYFQALQIDGHPFQADHIFCTADSKGSQRPRLTIEPLSQALRLSIDNRFKNKDVADLARALESQAHGTNFLVCWHHGEIPALLTELGADAGQLLPKGRWPEDVFGWMIELHYDGAGRLQATKLIHENLMPDDQPAR